MLEITKGSVIKKADARRNQPRLFFTQSTMVMNAAAGRSLNLHINKGWYAKLEIEDEGSDWLFITFVCDATHDERKQLHELKRGLRNGSWYLSLFDYLRNPKLYPQPKEGQRIKHVVNEYKFEDHKLIMKIVDEEIE